MTGRINATPVPSRPEITIVARIEDDASVYPVEGSGITVYSSITEMPVIAVRHLQVDPGKVGEIVLGLLRAQQLDEAADDLDAES